MTDYRTSNYVDKFSKVTTLKEEYKKKYPRQRNHYINVSSKKGTKKEFVDIYSKTCSYCGIGGAAISHELLEVDHFIPESSTSLPNNNLNNIQNLKLSCKSCNRGKSNLEFNNMHILDPDNSIFNYFERDDNFYIQIKTAHKTNPNIIDFYKKLSLGSDLKRLDYVIIVLQDILYLIENNDSRIMKFLNHKNELRGILFKLIEKRNSI